MDSHDLSIEPSAIRQLTPAQKDRLTDLLDGYLRRLEQGLPPPREDLLQANPDLAEPLGAYFDSLDELHDLAVGFQPPAAVNGEDPPPAEDQRRLGDFRLLREIGRGGMGVVYEAEQISLGRRVALKVLPFAAVLDSRQIARFKHEAEAAAQLDHPHIVSVYAVGVERGVHYYAMQFIDGQPLDRALVELRESGTHTLLKAHAAGRSEYFRTVARLGAQAAEALHAAHENGVVHRDIKPSNLLLDGNGKVWVTDFGLARRQTDATLTRTGDLVGTLRYMSPEQALAQAALVDHRTDIYSLGATLYEMLTLQPAFAGDEGPALIRRIERDEPRPPRQIQPKIPADLQTVVLKAMAKRREDRYHTAQQLADDLQRVLDGRPTVARPPSPLTRAARWAQRHREVVAAAILIVILAMGSVTAGMVMSERKTAANFTFADQRLREANRMVDRLGTLTTARSRGAAEIRRDLLRQTLAYYRDVVKKARDKPAFREDVALTYSKIGALTAEIGSIAEAVDADRQAIELFRDLAGANPHSGEYRHQLGVCQNNLALVLERAGQLDAARTAFTEAIRLEEEALGTVDDPAQCRLDLALACSNLGMLQTAMGEGENAAASLGRAVALQEQLLGDAPDDPQRLRDLALTLNLSGALDAERQPAKSLENYQKAVALQEKVRTLRPDDADAERELALSYNNLGAVQSRCGKAAEAAKSYAKVVEFASELVRRSPAEKSYRHTLAVGYSNLSQAESKLGKPAAAERSMGQALLLQGALVKQDTSDVEEQSALGAMYNDLGVLLEKVSRSSDAAAAYQQAVAHQRQAVAGAPESDTYRRRLDNHYLNYAQLLRKTGRTSDAARIASARHDLWSHNTQD